MCERGASCGKWRCHDELYVIHLMQSYVILKRCPNCVLHVFLKYLPLKWDEEKI